MWIQVRSMDGSKSVRIEDLSKLTKIEEVRDRLVEHFDADPSRQRLFYRGKQLEDGHSLFDYDVGLNDIIQLMIRPVMTRTTPPAPAPQANKMTNGVTQNGNGTHQVENGVDSGSGSEDETMDTMDSGDEEQIGLYKVKDKVDARDLSMGAWFEAEVIKVTKEATPICNGASASNHVDPTIYYHVKFDDYSEEEVSKLTNSDVRPRARYRMQWDQLVPGNMVMVNYNSDHPKERGFWYDALVTRKDNKKMELYAKLVLGKSTDAAEEVKITFINEIFRIETRTGRGGSNEPCGEGVARMKKPDCDWCKDNPRRKCKHCACCVCGGKDSPDKQILCDECNMAYHLWCLQPRLTTVPEEDDWYCPDCKTDSSEVIAAGEGMRLTKKKANMVSKKGKCNRDWGKGMATVGRTKSCTIVPDNHFGPIPGVPVGSLWKFRLQCGECGVHRPHVAGIHGRESEGAFSIVLSGGYEDDMDDGEEFTYSGSGGRDLSGNKRTASVQSSDQKLTHMNKALAKNCDAPIDAKNGAEGKDWQKGKPVRVIRNYKGSKKSKYAPKEGNRYDGIYKVVKYWPQKSKTTGFIVWKYLMRRDDPSPAPWTKEGKKKAEKLGLTMQYPEGYLETQAAKKKKAASEEDEDEEDVKPKKGRKRKSTSGSTSSTPVAKQPRFELTKQQLSLIKKDSMNKKLWEELLEATDTAGLLQQIKDTFVCIVCQEVVYEPISTPCQHNLCKTCLSRSFKAEVFSCPSCRCELGKNYNLSDHLNKPLQKALLDIFPGYNGGR